MTVLEYYFHSQPIEQRRKIVNAIIEKCQVKKWSAYNWISRKHAPPIYQEKLAEITGIEKKQLYKPLIIQN